MMIMKCACCGGDMKPDKDTGNSIIYKCSEYGLSNSRLKEGGGGGEEKSLLYTLASILHIPLPIKLFLNSRSDYNPGKYTSREWI
jgi:hypothetical protein